MDLRSEFHETVGRLFTGVDGIRYLCTRYVRSQGFWMRPIARDRQQQETCVSERAIGRTFRPELLTPSRPASEHEQPCECYCCRPPGG